MKRWHDMPFGAQPVGTGGVKFQLWAPQANRVDLCLMEEGEEIQLEMEVNKQGWFHIQTTQARVGSRYLFCIDENTRVPDPASRYQPDDVHGPSQVIDPRTWEWQDANWQGLSWEETIIYELHVGTFTPQSTFKAIKDKLDYLKDLGVTAIELMPVADFPGQRNWGYDGVFLFAPDSCYGRPEDLKDLIQNAHNKGLMVFLDVVYNHFGPEGNYLHLYAADFFTQRHHTPWGAAINFDGPHCKSVRDFFIHNALYWLEEYHFDGLRLDAVHAIMDDSEPDILQELAQHVRQYFGDQRHIHLVLENDNNQAHYLRRDERQQSNWYVSQWNDDIHHALHVLTTDEIEGYYQDYAKEPCWHLARCLAEGFSYQGENSIYRHGASRGEVSNYLPPTAFVALLQNHDQVGNRAFGERITKLAIPEAVRAATAVFLLAPNIPLLFMGQEWGSTQPFLFFCNFEPGLAEAVTKGRRKEFEHFPEFHDPFSRERIPDPNDERTFQTSILQWNDLQSETQKEWLQFHRTLIDLRKQYITPKLYGISGGQSQFEILGNSVIKVTWKLGDDSQFTMLVNMNHKSVQDISAPQGNLLFTTPKEFADSLNSGNMPAWSVALFGD